MARTLWVIVGLMACGGQKPPERPDPGTTPAQPAPATAAPEAPEHEAHEAPEHEAHEAPEHEAHEAPEHEAPSSEAKACGGIAGLKCPAEHACTDNPSDDCDPAAGAADCIGICKPCEDPSLGRTYMSRDPDQCARMKFMCTDGKAPFGDACGCGCS